MIGEWGPHLEILFYALPHAVAGFRGVLSGVFGVAPFFEEYAEGSLEGLIERVLALEG